MLHLTVEHVLVLALIMWLFNLLSYVSQRVKDVANSVIIILVILFWCFGLGAKVG